MKNSKRLLKSMSLALIVLGVVGCNVPAPAIVPGTVVVTDAPVGATRLPFKWPLPPLTRQQIAAVRDCAGLTAPPSSNMVPSNPRSACDWAVLALADTKPNRDEASLPEPALNAFAQAASLNPGFVLATPLFERYLGALEIVQGPPFAHTAITSAHITYAWHGMGQPVNYVIAIAQADAVPRVTVLSASPAISTPSPISSPHVQALAAALTDLFPINRPFSLKACDDNYPDWTVRLSFQDGTNLKLTTAGSNFLYAGGPWYTQIEGQYYMQVSPALTGAIIDLSEELGLPLGRPAAMYCTSRDVFDLAFPP